MIGMTVGKIGVVTSDNGGHGPEFFADRAVDKIMYVSESAPEPIKAQAIAYRERMRAIILSSITQAIASDRRTIHLENRS